MKSTQRITPAQRLRAILRRVLQEKSLGAMSAGKARRTLASEFAQAQRCGYLLPDRLVEATQAALKGPVRTFAGRTTWRSDLAIYQPVNILQAPGTVDLPEMLLGFSQRGWFRAA